MPRRSSSEINSLIEQAVKQMDFLINDMKVPRSIRATISNAKDRLLNSKDSLDIKISSVIYDLDSVSNDINIPQQERTLIWNILSILESIKVK
ncbi:MAG: hypothetical protein ARM1_0488 [Candidatus Micrarchaeota archaeon]|nr:MAG: hypothetical protein ARM1_0488 [Candidatus Micrarchaeota archaeon]